MKIVLHQLNRTDEQSILFDTQAKDNWSVVFTIGALVHLFGIAFYGIFACGELQDWAEPPVQEKTVWSPSGAAGYTEETSFVSLDFVYFLLFFFDGINKY